MSVATERQAPWSTRDYARMLSADYEAGVLTVHFADGDIARVPAEDLLAGRDIVPAWDRLTCATYEIVVPTTTVDLEIPWDVVRALTDPAFEQHLVDQAAESAKRIGARVRELREEQRLTERDLAERSGISPERLARIEAGADGISLPTLERLVAAMGHDMRVFIVADGQASPS